MVYTRRKDIEDIEGLTGELLELINELKARYSSNHAVVEELTGLVNYAEAIAYKIPKICKLRDFRSYHFAIVDPETGNVREATDNEAQRLIMGYRKESTLDLLRNWVVVGDKWVHKDDIPPEVKKELEAH